MSHNQNSDDLLNKWDHLITESFEGDDGGVGAGGIPESKRRIIAQIAENKMYILEGYNSATPANTIGIGQVRLPGDPGSQDDFYDDTRQVGSGDPALAILGLSMSIAAQTIAFDLVPVVPLHSELATLQYVDTKYAGGKFNSAAKPTFVKLIDASLSGNTDLGIGSDIVVHGGDDDPAVKLKMIQYGRLEKSVIVKVESTGNAKASGKPYVAKDSVTINEVIATATGIVVDDHASVAKSTDFKIDFAHSNDDHIQAASSYGNTDGMPVDRLTVEGGTYTELELETYTKAIKAETYTIGGKITRPQLRAFKSMGIDAIPLLKRAMSNEITQSINDHLLNRMRALGVGNHANLFAAQGINFNLFIGPGSTPNKTFGNFKVRKFIDHRGQDRTAEFGLIPNSETNSAAENMYSRQARLRSKILGAAAVIGNVSRFGAADSVIVNTQVLSALKESVGYSGSTVANNITQSSKALYYAGTMADIKIYCNPKWNYADTTAIVARTNKSTDGNDYQNLNQGLVFLPYDLAANIDTVAEGIMGPKFLVESVYAIAETGIHPELSYLTLAFDTDFGSWV